MMIDDEIIINIASWRWLWLDSGASKIDEDDMN